MKVVSEIDLEKLKAIVDKPNTATILSDVPDHVYHGGPGISNSGLSLLAKSPAHYKLEKESKDVVKKRKKSLDLGTAIHCAILEPDKLDEVVAYRKKVDGRTEEGKRYNAEWEALNADKIALNDVEFENLKRTIEAVHAHPLVSELLKKGRSEQSAYWTWDVEVDGEVIPTLCRGRMDWLTDDGIVVDLKTTVDASDLNDFSKSTVNYGYHRQQAWYQGGLYQILGAQSPFYFVWVENVPPFGVRVLQLRQNAVEIARAELQSYLTLYARCVKRNEWPCYRSAIETIDVPKWYKPQEAL